MNADSAEQIIGSLTQLSSKQINLSFAQEIKCHAKKNRKRNNSPEHTFLTITVDDYKVRTTTGPNSQILGSARYVKDDDEHAIVSDTVLELSGLFTDPEDRARERYDITLLGRSSDTSILGQRIKDLHRKSKDGFHEYRQYRGGNYPVYEDPPELGLVEKVRGESRWVQSISVQNTDPAVE